MVTQWTVKHPGERAHTFESLGRALAYAYETLQSDRYVSIESSDAGDYVLFKRGPRRRVLIVEEA